MATKTATEQELSREEAAEWLEELADELREGEFAVDIDNRTITLQPPPSIGMEVSVREHSSLLRGDRESVTIEMGWKRES